ncbi:YbdK family carboxylate-amine ligase [Labedella phragmitis]|uniref:Putative glutamate--cysteine ligase 2 n=1 Tax=Labedella phragmitis TaxID=2498849 RepID=A0A444PUM5_9MICO|nr:glutamate--cysteine ligase [Labedella phragmitis]RWZ51575.1 YbdK family carboxylate-amine ligase [Labedella phragmitis]
MRKIGIEEEMLLVHPTDGRPLALSAEALVHGHDHLQTELQQEMIEIASDPFASLADVRDSLLSRRREADDLARSVGARTAAIASSAVPTLPHLTPDDRYDWMAEHFGVTARRTMVCGCHVHVDISSREEGVGVLDRIRAWLPLLTALSTNSPFHGGLDTGYASYRSQVWSRWPSAGPLPILGDVEALTAFEDELLATGVLLDRGMLYFDARLSSRYPTVEVRVADVCLDIEHAVTIAGLARALVSTAAAAWAEDEPPLPVTPAALRLAAWRASAEGLGGELVHPLTGRPASAREAVDALLDHVGSALEDSGDRERITDGVDSIFRDGTGADRQRAVFTRSHSLSAVMLDAVEATAGHPAEA